MIIFNHNRGTKYNKSGIDHFMCEGNDSFFPSQIGSVLKKLFEEGIVKREDLWITSKLWFVLDSRIISLVSTFEIT